MSLTARIDAAMTAIANLIKGRQPLSTVLTDLSGRTVGVSQTNSILDRASGDGRYSQTKSGSVIVRMEAESSGGLVLTGSKGYFEIPYAHTLTGWSLFSDQNTNMVVDLKKSTYANFPSTTTITASAKPSLTAARKGTSNTLTGWTASGASGDVYEVNIDSNSAATSATFVLRFTKS
jgi:hypothetical protein